MNKPTSMIRPNTMSAPQRLWLLGGAFVALLLMIVGYLALIGPQRSETAAVHSRVDASRSANTVLQARISTMRVQSRHLATYRAQAIAAMSALPATSDVPAFLRTLQAIGRRTHTDAVSVTIGTPTDVTAVANGTTPAPAGSAVANGTTPAPAGSAAATTPAAATPAAAAAPPYRIYSLPITAQVNGSPSALGQFLAQLQDHQPRAVLITQLVQGSAGGDTGGTTRATGSTLQLTMQAFTAPGADKVK